MRNDIYHYVNRIQTVKTKRKRFTALLVAMSVLVSSGVSWGLRGIGTAMRSELLCGLEEHTHAEACGDACGIPEHVHSENCFSDTAADVETPLVWELTLPERSEWNLQENTALVAESQLGYIESASNIELADDGITQKHYSRYGAWYGNPYGGWNAMFTYFCLHYAGVPEDVLPYGAGVWAWSVKLEESGLFLTEGMPERGDVLFVDTDEDGQPDRTGIITATVEAEDALHILTIEGDIDGAVGEAAYVWGSPQIVGFVAIPQCEVIVLDMPAQEFSAVTDAGIMVTASAAENVFPAGTVMVVTDIAEEDAMKAASEGLETGSVRSAVAVDISFYTADGEEVEPADSTDVQVRISLPDDKKRSGDEYRLLHQNEDGVVEHIEDADVYEDGANFDAGAFSPYIWAAIDAPMAYSTVYSAENLILNKIYIQTNGNTYSDEPISLNVGDTIVAAVVFDNPEMQGGTTPYYERWDGMKGSQIWVWGGDTAVLSDNSNMEWQRLSGNKWLGTRQITALKKTDSASINLSFLPGGGEQSVAQAVFSVSIFEIPGNAAYGNFYIKRSGADYVSASNYSDGSREYLWPGETVEVAVLVRSGDQNIEFNLFQYFEDGRSDTYTQSVMTRTVNDPVSIHGDYWVSCVINASTSENGKVKLALGNSSVGADYAFNTIFFEVKSNYTQNKIYIKTAGGEFENNTSAQSPYVITVGEVLDLFIVLDSNQYYSTVYDDSAETPLLGRQQADSWDDGSKKLSFSFVGKNADVLHEFNQWLGAGMCRVIVFRNGNNSSGIDTLYVKVEESKQETIENIHGLERVTNHFYVDTALGERSKDRVHEYLELALANWSNIDPETDCVWDTNVDGEYKPMYVKNADGQMKAYLVVQDDDLTLTIYVPAEEADESRFSTSDPSITREKTEISEPFTYEGKSYRKITATFQIGASGNQYITYGNEILYIYAYERDYQNSSNHFDIEIADGGYYILKEIDLVNEIITITYYDAEVSFVNTCQVISKQNTVLATLDSGQYWKNGKPGEQQYELTSAYKTDGKGNLVNANGERIDRPDGTVASRPECVRTQIERVVFDVDLALYKRKVEVFDYTDGQKGDLKSSEECNGEEEATVRNVFDMNYQEILDAQNKCPDHSGLDFTLKATAYIYQFPVTAHKEMIGRELHADDFSFELYKEDPTNHPGLEPMSTANNDGFGNIVFDKQNIWDATDYTFYIKEKHGTDDGIIYDDRVIRVVLDFEIEYDEAEDVDELVLVSITYWVGDTRLDLKGALYPTFTNILRTYELPGTGGHGTLPPYLTGASAVFIPMVFLLRSNQKRREGS